MIAVAVSLWVGIYLLIPSILFDKLVSIFIPAKKFTRSSADEVLYGVIIAGIPISAVLFASHFSYLFGNWPFALSWQDCLQKWQDYHRIVLALVNDSYFKENSSQVWDSSYRVWHHQLRFLVWMYLFLGLEILIWIWLLKSYGRMQKLPIYRRIGPLLVGRVSEWHVLLTTFLFDPAEQRTVFVDVVTSDGLYSGRVRSYFTENDGSLVGILLDESRRFKKKALDEARQKWRDGNRLGEEPKTRDYWTTITGGTHLYIPAEKIGNLNVRYEAPGKVTEAAVLDSMARQKQLKKYTLTVTLTKPTYKGNQQANANNSPNKEG